MLSFFEHQDQARRSTRRLIVLMGLGVLCMGLSIYGLLVLFSVWTGASSDAYGRPIWLHPGLLLATVGGTAVVVGLASGARVLSLRGGGSQVAEMLGGRLVSNSPRDALDKRLLNVVEEMAIASGVPVPQVFVLDAEAGINAFAAGYTLDDAAVAVTRGCLETLTRDELQGVIAHEFSHVLNGDMRMNIRIMGVVFGIVCVGLLGRLLMRAGVGTRRRRDNSALALLALGLGVMLVGLVGELFGKLIKAAVSRQREYLADASAVQFTRNPDGIASALRKIAGHAEGARVRSARAEEASHFFFSDIHKKLFSSHIFASHPPLTERIRRLDPSFDGRLRGSQRESPALAAEGARALHEPLSDSALERTLPLLAQVGTVDNDALDEGRRLLASLPEELVQATRSSFSASALVYALLLSDDPTVLSAQHGQLSRLVGSEGWAEARRLRDAVHALPRRQTLPLVELLAPALRELSRAQRAAFGASVQALIDADQRVSIFEYVLTETLHERMAERRPAHVRAQARYTSLKAVRPELELVLSLIVHAGHTRGPHAEQALAEAVQGIADGPWALLPASSQLLSGLSLSLAKLAALTPPLKRVAFEACMRAARADRQVSDDEFMLLRALGDALGCPLPAVVHARPRA